MWKEMKLKKRLVRYLFRNSCFVILWRLLFKMQLPVKNSSLEVFDSIYENNIWGSQESSSGGGSTVEATVSLREFLPSFFEKYNIHSVLDIPCGDYNWMKLVDKSGIEYIGADIVEKMINRNKELYTDEHVSFRVLDLTKDKLPKVDLIFCKDCLQHLSYEHVWNALRNIKRSESTYLLTTSYPLTILNYDIQTGGYRSLNLKRKPFCFPKAILKVRERSNASGNEVDKTMYLWRINDIPS